LKYISSIIISITLFFGGCTIPEDETEYYEDGSVSFPFLVDYQNDWKTYQIEQGSNYFRLYHLPEDCLITFETVYNDYSDFDIYYDQYSYYHSQLTDYLEIYDFEIDSNTDSLRFTYKVIESVDITVSLYMINNSFVKVYTNCN
jgi:hypothetical protein